MTLPNFVCVGAQKAGTTSLYNIIGKHPDVYVPENKEPRFFCTSKYDDPDGMEWYAGQFLQGAGKKIIADITPGYMNRPHYADRVLSTLGKDIKVLAILRHPAKRAYSQYQMFFNTGRETMTFEEAINHEKALKEGGFLSNSFYSEVIEAYRNAFGDHFKIIRFEDFIGPNKMEIVQDIFDFLDLKHIEVEFAHANKSRVMKSNRLKKIIYPKSGFMKSVKKQAMKLEGLTNFLQRNLRETPQKMDDALSDSLMKKYFNKDVDRLIEVTGIDFSDWKTKA